MLDDRSRGQLRRHAGAGAAAAPAVRLPGPRAGRAVARRTRRIHVPQRGPRRELIDLAEQNARHLLEELQALIDGGRRARR